MTDFLLLISFPLELEEVVSGRLFLSRSRGTVSIGDGLLSAYFENAADRDAAAESLRDLPIVVRSEERESVNWLDRYQQSLTSLYIGNHFEVAPDAALLTSDRNRLVIPQAQAFGTGSHESTALCLELLEELDLRGKSGLDIGTGSGILAFAMMQLGARRVVGFDIDADAIGAMATNRDCNGIPASLFIGALDALRVAAFDVVTMNILPEVIVPMLPRVRNYARGPLIVSGILQTQRDDIAREVHVIKERTKGEWWAAIVSP